MSAVSGKSRFYISVLSGALLALATGQAMAAPVQVPTSAQPGIIGRSMETDDRNSHKLDGNIVLPPMQDSAVEGSTEKVFVLKDVVLDDSSIYGPETFEKETAALAGQEVSFADLSRIANDMTRRYREDGYIFSRVVLPPQKIKDGVVHMRAVEGRVDNVEVTGTYKDNNGLIKRMADKIHTAGPTNTRDIERYLLLIDDLPGITARSFVKPSKTQGAGDLVIVVDEDPFEGSLTVDNRGSRFVGPWRGELVGAFNSLFGIHDRTTLRTIVASQSDELRYGEITHEEQLGSEGLRVKARYGITKTSPGGYLENLDINGDSKVFDLEAIYPLIRSREFNVNLNGGFDANNTTTDLSGIQVARDRVRTVRLQSSVDFTDSLRGINQFDVMATHGLNGLGATSDGLGRSRANGEHDFTRFNATATRVQDLFLPGVSALVSATGQYSNDPLLASEEFTVGGEGIGRAYDSGELAGDKGYGGTVELRYSQSLPNNNWLQSYQLYSFVDYGKVKNINPTVGETASDSLTSAGAGVRYNLAYDLSGYLEVDKPLNKDVNAERDDDTRIFGTLVKRF